MLISLGFVIVKVSKSWKKRSVKRDEKTAYNCSGFKNQIFSTAYNDLWDIIMIIARVSLRTGHS